MNRVNEGRLERDVERARVGEARRGGASAAWLLAWLGVWLLAWLVAGTAGGAVGLAQTLNGPKEVRRWQLEHPATWLAAQGELLVALDETGTVLRLDDKGATVVARGFQGPFVQVCAGRVLGVTAAGRLAWAPGLAEGDVGPPVSPTAKPLCLEDGRVVAVAPGGAGLLLLGAELDVLEHADIKTLPDAQPTLVQGEPSAVAVLTTPSTRYVHGVLGDTLEAESVSLLSLPKLALLARYELPAPFVFEALRVLPTTHQGEPALLATRSSGRGGAGVVLLRWRGSTLELLAESPEIGQARRWLNLFAVRDDRAYAVRTPHIGGVLERYRVGPTRLELESLAEATPAGGVTNHVLGSRNLELGLMVSAPAEAEREGEQDLLVLPAQDLRALWLFACAEHCRPTHRYPLGAELRSNVLSTTWRGVGAIAAADAALTVRLWLLPESVR